jgi:hypothetical protein
MKRFVVLFTWILISSAWPTATLQLEAAQAVKPQSAEIRINHDVLAENERLEFIFLDVLRGTGLHGGFVEMAVCSDLPKGRLQIKQGATVRQAMDALVVANPGYEWELKGGVIDLLPQGGAPLLRTKIPKFQMNTTDREILTAIGDVLNLPEVRERAAALGITQGPGQVGLFSGELHPVARKLVPVQIDLQNLSLQETLNRIVAFSPDGVWIYRETGCDGAKTYTVELASGY